MRAHVKAIKGSRPAARPRIDRKVYLQLLLQTWQSLAKTDTAAWLEHRRKSLKKLVTKCSLGLDNPDTDDDKKTWTAWAETNWQGQECMMTVATRLCAQLRLSVVDARFVETGRHCMNAKSTVAQVRMISNKLVQDKLAGLIMANDGTLPHAEDIALTSHARLAQHVMDEVRHNVGDKSSGATAFPATAILHKVLFDRSVDLRVCVLLCFIKPILGIM